MLLNISVIYEITALQLVFN